MFKQEIICSACDSHFIIVTRSDEDVIYCPFCADEIKYTANDSEEETE